MAQLAYRQHQASRHDFLSVLAIFSTSYQFLRHISDKTGKKMT
jgi:hypothetical protein